MVQRRLMMMRLLALVAVAPAGQAMAQAGYPPPFAGGAQSRVAGMQRERNRRVLDLQQRLGRGEISRAQYNDGVAAIDRDMNARIYGH